MSNVIHSGFVSGFDVSSLPAITDPWLVTTELNETIKFIDPDGNQRTLNALIIEAEVNTWVQILPSKCCVAVKQDIPFYYDLTPVKEIKIMGAIGTKFAWQGQFY